ncbi:MAG: 2-oxo acid dehydrogenase subunit E2 [Desulfurococcaceae archaeon]
MTEDIKYIADQYELELEELVRSAPGGKLTYEFLIQRIKELYYPRVREVRKLNPIRVTTARRLGSSYRTAVHVTLFREVKADSLLKAKDEVSSAIGQRVSITPLLLKPLAEVLKGSPFNAELRDEVELIIYEDVNIAVAVQTSAGLVAPVIRRVQERDFKELLLEYRELVERARSLKLKQKDLVGATFTITNLGMYGIDFFTQIINPPQVSILGVGTIKDKVIYEKDGLKNAKYMYVSLTFDHRAADGADAAEFLARLAERLENIKAENLLK